VQPRRGGSSCRVSSGNGWEFLFDHRAFDNRKLTTEHGKRRGLCLTSIVYVALRNLRHFSAARGERCVLVSRFRRVCIAAMPRSPLVPRRVEPEETKPRSPELSSFTTVANLAHTPHRTRVTGVYLCSIGRVNISATESTFRCAVKRAADMCRMSVEMSTASSRVGCCLLTFFETLGTLRQRNGDIQVKSTTSLFTLDARKSHPLFQTSVPDFIKRSGEGANEESVITHFRKY